MPNTKYSWFIPSIIEVLDNKVDEMQVTINSEFKMILNFTNKANDQINLLLYPLISISEFEYKLHIWMNNPRDKEIYTMNSEILYDIVKIPDETVKCIPHKKVFQLTGFSAEKIKQIVKNRAYSHHIPAIGLNIDLTFCHEAEIAIPVSDSMSLLNDLEQLFISGDFKDAVIKTTEGKEIKVHKNILAMRCKVFKAMFQHETVESATNTVETPFDEETIENLLLYIYCYKTPNIDTIADKLLVAADYYQLNDLKNRCAERLIEKLSGENVVEILELAVIHSCMILEEGALNLIHNLDSTEIVESKGWVDSTNVEVFKKISKHLIFSLDK